MNIELIAIILATLISGTIVRICIPKIMLVSLRKKLLDPTDPRKVHTDAASRLGGLSFFPAIFIATHLCIAGLGIFMPSIYEANHLDYQLTLEFTALIILFLVGLYDDIVTVRYIKKFIVQIFTAVLVVGSGTYVFGLYSGANVYEFSLYFTIPVSIVLIVFITNALNLIDGINGLASILSILAFTVYGVLFYSAGQIANSLVCFTASGALGPFFYHNVFGVRKRTKSRIFMGDGGALVIGFLLSIMSIKLWNIEDFNQGVIDAKLCHIMAFTMLLVPCLDVVRVVIHRARERKALFLPDKNHIHHKFMALGFTSQHSLLLIIGIQVVFVVVNLLLSISLNIFYILAIDLVLWTTFHMVMSRLIKRRVEKRLSSRTK